MLLYFCRVDWIVENFFGADAGAGDVGSDFGAVDVDVTVDVVVCLAADFVVLVVDVVDVGFVDVHCYYLVHIC